MNFIRRIPPVLIAAIATSLIAAGCSSEEPGRDHSSTQTPASEIADAGAPVMQPREATQPKTADPQSILTEQVHAAEQTIRRGLEAMFTWYPSTDASPADAVKRATRYLTVDMAKTSGTNSPTLQWVRWKEARASVIATADIQADEPDQPDSVTQIKRVVAIVQHVDVGEGSPTPEPAITAWVTARQTSGGWRISAMTF